VGVCRNLEAKFGRNAMKQRQGRHLGVADSADDEVSSLRSVAVSKGCLLHPAHSFLTAPATAPLEVEDFEIHDEHDDITDPGENLGEEDESQDDDNLDEELDATLDGMCYPISCRI
jgi:hypothetical protein